MEIKVILFTLLRNFVFELSDPNLIIETIQGWGLCIRPPHEAAALTFRFIIQDDCQTCGEA